LFFFQARLQASDVEQTLHPTPKVGSLSLASFRGGWTWRSARVVTTMATKIWKN